MRPGNVMKVKLRSELRLDPFGTGEGGLYGPCVGEGGLYGPRSANELCKNCVCVWRGGCILLRPILHTSVQ